MRDFFTFLGRCTVVAFTGTTRYKAWLAVLFAVVLVGLNAYSRQVAEGLILTGLSDQVSWGLYIANFTYLVGIAAAAVLVVIPVYVYRDKTLRDLVVFGEAMAVSALVMCIAFVLVDLGRPDRFWHMLPVVGRVNFPSSILAWDVLVLLGYLALNVYLGAYIVYTRYMGIRPAWWRYMPFVIISIVWAVAIHTVTAFLYMGLAGRPFWNTAILGPRFIASAFTAGPALIVITLLIIRRVADLVFGDEALLMLRRIIQVAIIVNLFLLLNEMFAEFYASSLHSNSARYLYFGLEGQSDLVPHIWTAIVMNFTALVIFVLPISRRLEWLALACVLSVGGLWIEKGLGLIVPGFLPTPLGEMVVYVASANEIMVSSGIWAFGVLIYSMLVRVALAVVQGRLANNVYPELPVAKSPVAAG